MSDQSKAYKSIKEWQDAWFDLEEKARELRAENAKLHRLIKWLLGENGDFPIRKEGEGGYYWRKELRKRWEALAQKEAK